MTSVEIPFGVIIIEGYSFDRNNLTSVSIPSSVALVDSDAFAFNPLETISISKYHNTNWMKYADWASDNTKIIRRENEAPRNILISLQQITDRKESNSEIARLSTVDEVGDDHSYALVPGEGSVDNDLFSIDGDLIRINQIPNYANRDHYSIRVKTMDLDGLTFERSHTLSIASPIDFQISSSAFDENISIGTIISTLGNINDDTNDYTLISGDGSDNNDFFSIVDDQLIIQTVPDYEFQNSYNIRISYKDSMGLTYGKSFTFTVNDINDIPTDLNLSSTSFYENIAVRSPVAFLTTSDEDANDTHTYTLVSGDGSEHNDAFEIVNNQITIKEPPDYETQNRYNIRMRTTDPGGLTLEKAFTLTVDDLPEKNFDFNGDGNTTLEHDAIIGLRMMFGTFPGDALIDGAITPKSTKSITDILELMSDAKYDASFDLDSDGIISPFTDGFKLIEEIQRLQIASPIQLPPDLLDYL